jgi:hypothetical protein
MPIELSLVRQAVPPQLDGQDMRIEAVMTEAILTLPQSHPWPVRLVRWLGEAMQLRPRPADVRELPEHLLRDLFPDDAEARRLLAQHCPASRYD